ncbi:expressed unknown protein [Seminavis robusta]|uniref:Uncharacterized protein n=1 Tax=Seminavis robusta TaxID=568900 RepID=A0A9N8H949_9STRA|nr:expressed unknown protein [Seminavis robusta]|eukprot:Sro179_g078440.1 n/a (214) ;mRNA; f:30039-30801
MVVVDGASVEDCPVGMVEGKIPAVGLIKAKDLADGKELLPQGKDTVDHESKSADASEDQVKNEDSVEEDTDQPKVMDGQGNKLDMGTPEMSSKGAETKNRDSRGNDDNRQVTHEDQKLDKWVPSQEDISMELGGGICKRGPTTDNDPKLKENTKRELNEETKKNAVHKRAEESKSTGPVRAAIEGKAPAPPLVHLLGPRHVDPRKAMPPPQQY